MQALSQIIGFFTNTFLGPIWAAGITLFYYDQRVRKEGYDIEWMMQAAGLTPPGGGRAGCPAGTVGGAVAGSRCKLRGAACRSPRLTPGFRERA